MDDGRKRQLLEIGKIKGYEGHHILIVNELKGTVNENLISSADDIVFLSKNDHHIVHAGGDTFATTEEALIKVVPWIAERVQQLLSMVGGANV